MISNQYIEDNQIFRIMNVCGLFLGISEGGLKNNAQVVLQKKKVHGNHQKFIFKHIEHGYYTIRCLHSSKQLGIYNQSLQPSDELVQEEATINTNQQFKLLKKDGCIAIECRHSSLVWDVNCGKLVENQQIIQWEYHGGDNQHFILVAE